MEKKILTDEEKNTVNHFKVSGFISRITKAKSGITTITVAMPKYRETIKGVEVLTNYPVISFTKETAKMLEGFEKQDFVCVEGCFYVKKKHGDLYMAGEKVTKMHPIERDFKHTRINNFDVTGVVTFVNFNKSETGIFIGITTGDLYKYPLYSTVEFYDKKDKLEEMKETIKPGTHIHCKGNIRTRRDFNKHFTFTNLTGNSFEVVD